MTWLNAPPIILGQSSTNGSLAQALGQEYWLRGGVSSTSAVNTLRGYRLMYNNSGGTLAAGDVLIEERTTGVENGYCTTTTVAAHPDCCAIVPAEFGTNTVAAASYFLAQIAGPGKAKFASTAATYIVQTTVSASAAFGTATTAGYAQLISVATTTLTLDLIGAYAEATLGRLTNSAVVTAAGQLGNVRLSRFRK